MYKFLFSRYQSTEEGNGAVNSLGTSYVAVSVQHHGVFCCHPRKAPLDLLEMAIAWNHLGVCVWCFLPVSLCAALALAGDARASRNAVESEVALKIHTPVCRSGC